MNLTREQILNDAMTDDNEKTFAGGITVRRIGVREELLMEMAGSPFLKPENLKTLLEGSVPAGMKLQDAHEMIFICATDPQTTRELLRSGRHLFEDAVFGFLSKIPSRQTLEAMIRYLCLDLLGIKAATFDTIAEHDSAAEKNGQSPAASHSLHT